MVGKKEQKQVTKKQHWVPQFYLKQFANDKGFINILDIKRRAVASPRPYGSVCYDDYFYGVETGVEDEISQQFEDYFREIENKAAGLVADFCKKVKNDEQLSDGLLYSMAFFMSSLWGRSEYFRSWILKTSEDMYRWSMKTHASHKSFSDSIKRIAKEHGKEISEKEVDEMRELIISNKYKLKFTNSPHLRFLSEVERYTNLFYNKHWRIYIAAGDKKFITSDTPISEWIPERKGFYGASFLERKHYFAVSPDVLIELIYPHSGKKVKRKRIQEFDVLRFNLIKPEYSLNYCYANNKVELEDLVAVAEYYNPINELKRHLRGIKI